MHTPELQHECRISIVRPIRRIPSDAANDFDTDDTSELNDMHGQLDGLASSISGLEMSLYLCYVESWNV